MIRCLLLVAMTSVCVSAAAPNRQLRSSINIINRKMSAMKRTFDSEIARLEYEVIDLRAELEMERARTDELERALNDTSGAVGLEAPAGGLGNGAADGGLDTNTISTVNSLDRRVKAQTSLVHDLEQSVGHLQRTTSAMEAGIDDCRSAANTIQTNVAKLKNHSVQLNTFSENITDVISDISLLDKRLNENANEEEGAENQMKRFARSIKLAFKSEKMKLKTLTAELKQSSGGIQEEALNEINNTLQGVREMTEENRLFIDRIDWFVNVTAKEVEDVKGIVEDKQFRQFLDEGITTTTARPAPVTLAVGGPKIYPIYEEDLARAIEIGSRVVRGRDWSWHEQDGIPPGAGTVTGWYGGDKTSQQVVVRWDRGQTANYRIGAHGKYDLYLLADEDSVPTASPTTTTTQSPEKRSDIQQIFGPALKNAIKIGSRVVRGEDWGWGSQDGVPPGPGTVTQIGMGYQNMEVMVTWDAGRSANYRIGAHGRYDLYLLA